MTPQFSAARALNDCGYLVQSRDFMFDHPVWWGEALKVTGKERTLRIPLRPEGQFAAGATKMIAVCRE
jgi:hypothetical protein